METARLAIPVRGLQTLASLPPTASLRAKDGRASVDVRLNGTGDTVYVTATCDSLAQLVIYYQRKLSRIRADTTSVVKEEERVTTPFSPKAFFLGMGAGALLLGAFLVIIKIRK
jgi:hypothetical protein